MNKRSLYYLFFCEFYVAMKILVCVKLNIFAHCSCIFHPLSFQHTHTHSDRGPHSQWFKSTLLFIKATLRTKKVACQNLFSRQSHKLTVVYLIPFFFFTVQSITTTKYMLLPLQKGPGNCGTAKVKTNSALIYLHNFHVVHLVTVQNGLHRWEMSHQIQG